MELWQLRTFSIVAKTLHFTRASEELNLSQPAVSHQIKSLEAEIGEPLFIRDSEGVILTKVGKTLLDHANKILDIAYTIQTEMKEAEHPFRGKVVIGVATRGLGNPLAEFVENFRKTYSKIDLVIQNEYVLEDISEGVRRGTIDIGMVSHNLDLSGLAIIPYGEYNLRILAGKSHPLASKKEITIGDLQQLDWVTFEPENRIRKPIREFANRFNIKTKSVIETNDGALIRSLVASGKRISILPEWGVFEELRDGRIVAVDFDEFNTTLNVNLIWKESRFNKAIGAVLSDLMEHKLEGLKLVDPNPRG